MSDSEIAKELYPFPEDSVSFSLIVIIVIGAILCSIITLGIAGSKRREGISIWLFLGFVLGPIGILIALLTPKIEIPPNMKECPVCDRLIAITAVECISCKAIPFGRR